MTAVTTSRLVLREFVDRDLEAIHGYAADPVTTRYMVFGPNTREETQAFLERCMASASAQPRTDYEWAITLKSGELIGGCGLGIQGPGGRQGYLGYILHRAHWGRGYGTEAAAAIIGFGFGELRLHRIWSDCVVDNAASAHIMEKCGMTREGRLRHYSWKEGEWRDHYLYAILEHEADRGQGREGG